MSTAAEYDVFQAIADPTRREVLNQLARSELYIGQITTRFPISRPAVAKHLKILLQANLVEFRTEGRKKYYSLNPEPLQRVKSWISYFESFWIDNLQNLKKLAEDP